MADRDVSEPQPQEEWPDVRAALRRAFEHGREATPMLDHMEEIREITFFENSMLMRVERGELLDRLRDDDGLRSDVELSLSAAFGRFMELKVHPFLED